MSQPPCGCAEQGARSGKEWCCCKLLPHLAPSPLPLNDPVTQKCAAVVVDDLLREMIEEACIDVHRQLKTGQLCMNCNAPAAQKAGDSHDLFGQSARSMVVEQFECQNCGRGVIATRYVPHLEKCLGLGRASSRLATRRIAAIGKDGGGSYGGGGEGKNGSSSSSSTNEKGRAKDDDAEFVPSTTRRVKKAKRKAKSDTASNAKTKKNSASGVGSANGREVINGLDQADWGLGEESTDLMNPANLFGSTTYLQDEDDDDVPLVEAAGVKRKQSYVASDTNQKKRKARSGR